ncbi:MAG: leucine-rich repeat protein [Oscillospiraceae bacterium]|nr:leucine-rich repeat protein [Oscillospiraceae bacterium]
MLTAKRICALLLALVMVFGLVACGGEAPKDNPANDPAPQDPVDPAPADPVDPNPITPAPADPAPIIPASPLTMSDEEVLKAINYDTVTTRGMCGDNLYWAYKDGVLTITGTGEMYTYGRGKDPSPWREQELDPIRVVIGEGATSIGPCAFYQIETLEAVSVPQSVTNLGFGAFEKCSALKSFTMPNAKEVGTKVFWKCTSLESVTIGGTLDRIADNFCNDCPNLKTVTLSDSITTIGASAFHTCPKLSSINMPKNLQVIQSNAFAGCTSLTKVNLPQSTTQLWMGAFTGCTSLSEVTVPGIVRIAEYVFQDCTALKEITLPATVTECYGLGNSGIEKVYVPASVSLETISGLVLSAEAYFAEVHPEITLILQ